MPTLILQFPAGRYHATPWGHHVNEGMIEWPPSPWRLLRGLLATGYATMHWPAAGAPPEARSLIEKLAAVLPCYVLPKAVGTHSRHYMPMARFKNGREETCLVFDTWARVSGELAVTWDVPLSPDEQVLLEQLAERMGYLGRSESWINAHVATPSEAVVQGERCWPEGREAPLESGWEQVPMYAPIAATAYVEWRDKAVAKVMEDMPQPEPGKKPTAKMKKELEKATKPYPLDLLACLQMQTSELQGFGWNQPPGSQRVFYWRKANAIEVGVPKIHRVREVTPVEAMLLAMATQSGSEHALPSVTRTLSQAEMLHRQLVGSLRGRHNIVLTGCDEQRKPLTLPHQHAHILPLDMNGDGHLDHILVWAPMGLDGEAQSAIRNARRTYTKGGVGVLRLALAGAASLDELLVLSGEYGAGLRKVLHKGTEWISATPFVPPRYVKKNGAHTLEGQVRAELASRNLPDVIDVQVLDPHEHDLARRQRHFIRTRRFGPAPPIDCGFALQLRFAEPVQGPICLGYGSHFGLGMFRTIPDQQA